jgi:hypothetical protein
MTSFGFFLSSRGDLSVARIDEVRKKEKVSKKNEMHLTTLSFFNLFLLFM